LRLADRSHCDHGEIEDPQPRITRIYTDGASRHSSSYPCQSGKSVVKHPARIHLADYGPAPTGSQRSLSRLAVTQARNESAAPAHRGWPVRNQIGSSSPRHQALPPSRQPAAPPTGRPMLLFNPRPNDPSSATRRTRRYDRNRDALAGFAEADGFVISLKECSNKEKCQHNPADNLKRRPASSEKKYAR
jgi:hypothetical protein